VSYDAYCLSLMNRALARPSTELLPCRRPFYEARRIQLAQRLIGAGC
jgi:hypothetical protein